MAENSPQEEVLQFDNDAPFHATEETQRTLKSDDVELLCHCWGVYGRNLVVCIDGTANQFSTQNTNIVELYSRLVKSDEQLTYYNSGIGTYVKDSSSWFSFRAWKQSFNHNIDKGFATNFKSKVLGAYQWLSENYRPGDRIFLFGFSRGAYQVRVIAGMIEKVGLLHKGNNEQIAFAYDLYTQTIATKNPQDLAEPEELCKRFKHTLSHRKARTHFVGAWDTVSAIGVFRGPNLPETTTGMRHVCAFRHALALDELRVKFLPEYANGGAGPNYEKNQLYVGDVKEVWFAGSHSDIGGGNVANLQLDHFGPSLRWMSYEAIKRGLKIEPHQSPWESLKPESSMNWFYGLLEYFPISRLSYTGPEDVVSWPPPLQNPRKILSGQMIHESVFDSHLKEIEYTPIARFHDDKLVWDESLLRKQQLIEDDPYIRADHVLDALNKSNQKLNRLSDEHFDALVALSATPIGRQSIREFTGSADILISALELEWQRLEKNKQRDDTFLIVALAKALNSFDTIPLRRDPDFNPALWSILSEIYPKSSSEWLKIHDCFGPDSSACAVFIGIDAYQSPELTRLRGCVADANDLASVIKQVLNLSTNQVSVISDARATRATIIRSISHLSKNTRISPGDPIVIFFAGHTSLDNHKMASIVPYDYPQSQPISSDLLNDLIGEIAAAKGNNITLILDCAYAGAFGSHSFIGNNTTSHVLLAACGKTELAKELSGRGWFSSNLSEILRAARVDSSHPCTYQDLVKRFPVGNQTPQCIGYHTDRFLFDKDAPSVRPLSYKVTKQRLGSSSNYLPDSIVISTGEIHGVTKGAVFKIQGLERAGHDEPTPSFLGTVDSSLPFSVTTQCGVQELQLLSDAADASGVISEDTPGQRILGVASLIHDGVGSELSVAVTTDISPASRTLVEQIAKRDFEPALLKFVNRDSPYQLLMSVRKGKVALDVMDGKVQNRIPVQIPDVESLSSALKHAARFLGHLWQSPGSVRPKNLSELVTVEVWELSTVDGKYTSASSPIGENLVQNGTIQIPIREDKVDVKFAFKMTNASTFKLYAWVFAFDPLDLSIETLYKPPFINDERDGVTLDPCLPSNGHLLFSDVSNTTHLSSLPVGADKGVAYLKVFLSSQYTDLSIMQASSPFANGEDFTLTTWGPEWSSESPDVYDPFIVDGTTSTLRLRGGGMRPYSARIRPFWDSFIIPIHRNRETLGK